MGLTYRKAKTKLTYREGKPEVYKMRQLTFPPLTYKQLLAEVVVAGVNASQTAAVVEAVVNRMAFVLSLGHAVQFGSFGTFKPTFNSKVAHTLDETTLDTVKVKKIQFYPGAAFREMLSNLDLFEDKSVSEKDPEGEDDEDGD
ncbi:MAG: hypothetical protein IJP75_11440 [Bacteroidaceae bacterium]|nr:hypothetical protein [Bacteroidaceae bacterium]